MAADGYAKGSASDADLMHGAGQTGPVLHSSARHSDITSSSKKGADAGMNATLGRAKATSDYSGSTPEDVTTAPGQRTVLKPKASMPSYGAQSPAKAYQ